jgi:hypothetical protein
MLGAMITPAVRRCPHRSLSSAPDSRGTRCLRAAASPRCGAGAPAAHYGSRAVWPRDRSTLPFWYGEYQETINAERNGVPPFARKWHASLGVPRMFLRGEHNVSPPQKALSTGRRGRSVDGPAKACRNVCYTTSGLLERRCELTGGRLHARQPFYVALLTDSRQQWAMVCDVR